MTTKTRITIKIKRIKQKDKRGEPMSTQTRTLKVSTLALLGALSLLPSFAVAETADNRDVVHDRRGNVVTNRWGNCVRTKWVGSADECANGMAQVTTVKSIHELAKEDRTVYFDFDKALLTKDSTDRLDALSASLKNDDKVKQARIVGFADRIGSKAYNEKLSERRAAAVRKYLEGKGIITSHVTETRWLGETAPVTTCADTLKRPELIACLQKDRRVEVEIDYVTPKTETTTKVMPVKKIKH